VRTSRAPGSSVDEATGRRREDGPREKAAGRPRGLRARLAPFASPPWLKSPLLLFRFPRLLAALGGAVFILVVVTASSPLFLSSAGNRILSNTIATACPWDVGLSFTTPLQVLQTSQGLPNGLGVGSAYAGAEATVNSSTNGMANLGPVEKFGIGASMAASRQGAAANSSLRLIYRTDALDHVTKLASAGGAGIWLARSTAQKIGAKPGDTIQLASASSGTATVRVAGVYQDLITQPRRAFWCQQAPYIFPLSAFSNYVPPPFGIVDQAGFFGLEQQLRDTSVVLTWERQLRPGITLPEANVLGGQVRALLTRPDLGFRFVDSRAPFLAEDAQGTVESMRGPVDTIAIAGRIVALAVIVVAGLLWLDRRRTEVRLLAAKGAGPGSVGMKVLLEVLLPAALATVAGVLAARWLVRSLGPTSVIDTHAVHSATRQVIWTTFVALVLLALVTALASRRVLEASGAGQGQKDAISRYPWEVAVLTLAGAALYEISTRGTAPVQSGSQIPKVDRFLLLFPILFILGGAGLIVRLLRMLLPVLRSRGAGWSPSRYLATRRLVDASRTAFALVIAAAVALGILLYAGTLSTSVDATGEAKARVFTGAETAATLRSNVTKPPRTPFASTVVRRIERAVAGDGTGGIDVMGIDRRTFASTAFWDKSFATVSLSEILRLMAPGPPGAVVPVVVTGAADLPQETTLTVPASGISPIPIKVVARAVAFPGMRAGSPLIVMDRDVLRSRSEIGLEVLWANAPGGDVLAAMRRDGLEVVRSVTTADVKGTSQFLSLSWTFGFLQALGILTGLVALGGAVMYLEARQRSREVSYALARRMGLSRRAHRRSIALELGAILLASLAIGGALAWIAARLVYQKLDPIPNIPPPPLFRLPVLLSGVSLAVVLFASWLGARRVQRAADHARVTEVMRLAG
jgi:putative ABC transport system permease protein